MIYILTGDIRTGKTTALLNWVNTSAMRSGTGRKDVDGLLCPDGENGKRYFLKIKSQKEIELEVALESEKVISVGPFYFLESAFETANNYLIETAREKDFQYMIIDELGKLELKNKGLHDAAKTSIAQFMFNENKHLILVVRESLFEDIINHYTISEYSVLGIEDLENLK
ncbi:nucleoside-triphosphatase [Winogradskyella flava]|uniref:Nucleoside-triphosphatase THEP1 n=1 Tax=Winogradskyella flava TaxID=1884876 RepID=A0A842INZ6_9FLAO|nr:hypothetical protein [Winogradskyella flava]